MPFYYSIYLSEGKKKCFRVLKMSSRGDSYQELAVFRNLSDHECVIRIVVDAEDINHNILKEGDDRTTYDRTYGTDQSIHPFRGIHLCKEPKGACIFLERELLKPVIGMISVEG